jgi:hypothetical protein
MRVIFLTHSSDQGHRFRVEQYFSYRRALGVEATWLPLRASLEKKFLLFQQLPRSDVVCIQRRLSSPFEFYWSRFLSDCPRGFPTSG